MSFHLEASASAQDFFQTLNVQPDPFQIEAVRILEQGYNLLVTAPTGSGKTLLAHFALFSLLQKENKRLFYTTPIKALSNQKYREFCQVYGVENVGLLTGDATLNPNARCLVMTTEVLRNMIYSDFSEISDVGCVVMDEVHYLADKFRGSVWEEIIIHLPTSVQLVCLSATLSNSAEFGDWIESLHGPTLVVVCDTRPVVLEQHIVVEDKIIDLLSRENPEKINPVAIRAVQQQFQHARSKRSRRNQPSDKKQQRISTVHLVNILANAKMLPTIIFIFSRAGCDKALLRCLRSDICLTTSKERERIRKLVTNRCQDLSGKELYALGFNRWQRSLEKGFAAHHAGLIPLFKEIVEELFAQKLLKVVFATETLSLGINMPAKSVVLETLEKFTGESRRALTAGEYTQLTGRAGRRGIDTRGHSLVLAHQGLDLDSLGAVISQQNYQLMSSFSPTYNMSLNMIDRYGKNQTHRLLESSFAQFQTDRKVLELADSLEKKKSALEGYKKALECSCGNFLEYSLIRQELSHVERKKTQLTPDERVQATARLRTRLKGHPCHTCPDREKHARWSRRWNSLQTQIISQSAQIEANTGAISRVFERIVRMLVNLQYLQFDDSTNEYTLTSSGLMLKRIYCEQDLLLAEVLQTPLLEYLNPAEFAAFACAFVLDADDRKETFPEYITAQFDQTYEHLLDVYTKIQRQEKTLSLAYTSLPNPSRSRAMYDWVNNVPLDVILGSYRLSAGDFVRCARQTIDLLEQISILSSPTVSVCAKEAKRCIDRDLIFYASSLL